MAMIFTIDLIEGNSHIGVPVFSSSGKKENMNYMVFSQPKQPKKKTIEELEGEDSIVEVEGQQPNKKDMNRSDKVIGT